TNDPHQADHILLQKLRKTLENGVGARKYKDVSVRVSKGAVILTGMVDSERERQIISRQIHNIPGVKEVDDQLSIRTTLNDSDRKLLDKITNNLGIGTVKTYRDVSILVNNGTVSLRGAIDSEKDRQDLKNK